MIEAVTTCVGRNVMTAREVKLLEAVKLHLNVYKASDDEALRLRLRPTIDALEKAAAE